MNSHITSETTIYFLYNNANQRLEIYIQKKKKNSKQEKITIFDTELSYGSCWKEPEDIHTAISQYNLGKSRQF